MAVPVRPLNPNQGTTYIGQNLQGIRKPNAFSVNLPPALYMEGTDGLPTDDAQLDGKGSSHKVRKTPEFVPFWGPSNTYQLGPA